MSLSVLVKPISFIYSSTMGTYVRGFASRKTAAAAVEEQLRLTGIPLASAVSSGKNMCKKPEGMGAGEA